MKFYKYIKKKYRKTSKLFGITIFEQIFNHLTTKRYQYFLNGIVTTYKVKDIYDIRVEKVIKFLGVEIIKRIEDGDNCFWYCSGKLIRKISAVDVFKSKYIKYFNKKYDDIYILTANSGETFLFLTYIWELLTREKNSRMPLIVATKKYHIDLINMICSKVPYIYIKAMDMNIKNFSFTVDKFRIFSIFPHEYFLGIEVDIKDNVAGKVNYFTSMLKYFGYNESDLIVNSVNVPNESEKSMLNKIKSLNLDLSKFIFIAPEAITCELLDNSFWKILIEDFKNLGFDIFVNLVDTKFNIGLDNYKTCSLSVSEAFALAKRAKKIVTLRSGFSELLVQAGVPIDILYNKFRNRRCFNDMSVKQVMEGFSLKKLPMLTNRCISEYEYNISDQSSLIKEIVGKSLECQK